MEGSTEAMAKGWEILVEGWVRFQESRGLGQGKAQGVVAGMDGYQNSRVQGLESREWNRVWQRVEEDSLRGAGYIR